MEKEKLKKRIKEVEEAMDYKWATPETRNKLEARLERLEQLQDDLYEII